MASPKLQELSKFEKIDRALNGNCARGQKLTPERFPKGSSRITGARSNCLIEGCITGTWALYFGQRCLLILRREFQRRK